jgi:hypothetical protein
MYSRRPHEAFDGHLVNDSGNQIIQVVQRGASGTALVVDAVAVEPVSTLKFPANREKNREFCKIAASGAPEIVNNTVVTGLLIRTPCSTEQGIIFAKQGSLVQEQGIPLAKTQFTVG